MSSRVQTYLGVIVGLLGWMIGLTVICLATGQSAVLAGALPVGLAVSLALAGMTLALIERAAHRFGRRSALVKLCKWGAVCLDLGILLMLANHWLMPMIQANSAAARAINGMPGVTSVPDGIPVALLLLASLLLGMMAWLAARPATDHLQNSSPHGKGNDPA